MLLDGSRVIGAALDGRVVGDDDAFLAGYPADAGHDAGAGDLVIVHAIGGKLRQFKERGAGIQQAANAVAYQQLATPQMLVPGPIAAAP